MAENSNIEWTDHTFNPWIGCAKVSPGCANCYAEAMMDTRYGKVKWGKRQKRIRTSAANWKLPVKWNRAYDTALERRDEALEIAPPGSILPPYPVRQKVFCASLADWLDEEIEIEVLADLLKLIHDTPNLDWLMLTKRPENFESRMTELMCFESDAGRAGLDDEDTVFQIAFKWTNEFLHKDYCPENVWIGTSIERQEYADKRISELLNIPAKVRFLSVEPILGPIDLAYSCFNGSDSFGSMPGIHWVINGGESGPKRRPMKLEWARDLRDQCARAKVAYFFKQIDKVQPIPADLMVRQFPTSRV